MTSKDIDYYSPLAMAPPDPKWVTKQFKEGYNNAVLTRKDVPFVDLSNKWIIITGANNGIGREAALFFSHCGANIILACRTPPPHEIHPTKVVEECKEAASVEGRKIEAEWWDIDMGKLRTVEAFAKRWLETGRALDILCNNAGMGTNPGGIAGLLKTEDGAEFVHQVNFSSHVLLTLLLLPSLAKAKAPRIVCTTSNTTYWGNFDLHNWEGKGCVAMNLYSNNKLYYQVFINELQARMNRSKKYKHITINGVHPGYVNTGIWQFNTGSGLFSYVVAAVKVIIQLRAWWWAISPEQGSYCIAHAATADIKSGGKYFNRIKELENMPHCRNEDARMRVWTRSTRS